MAGYAVTITAVDGATKAIDAINKKLAALTAPVTRLQKSLDRFREVSGLNAVARGLGTVATAAARAARSLAAMVAPLAAITSAFSIAGITALATEWAKFAQRLGFDASRISIAADRLHALQGAAALAGSSGEALTSGMKALSDTLTDAAGGRNGEAVVMFRTLGVEFRNADGTARRAADVMPQLADAIARIRNPALQARVATMLFGGAAEDLLPFLKKGSEGMRQYAAEARRFGVVSEEGVRIAGAMREAQTRLGLAWQGMGNVIAEKVSPILTRIFNFMAEWLRKNSGKIVGMIEAIAKAFEKWLNNGGLDKLMNYIERIAKALSDLTMPAWMQRWLGISGPESGGGGDPSKGASPWITNPMTGFTDVPQDWGLKPYSPPPSTTTQAPRSWWRRNMPTWMGGDAPASNNSALPRGFRNNNPLNLTFLPGQGAIGSDGRFGRYATMEEGIAANHRQLLRYQDRGLNTVESILNRWAPPSENDTEGYIRNVSAWTGFKRDQALNLRDPETAQKLISAMSRQESGNLPPDVVARGVALALGTAMPPARIVTPNMAAAAAGAGGGVSQVVVTFKGAPPGTTVSTSNSGPVRTTARVETAMGGVGSP